MIHYSRYLNGVSPQAIKEVAQVIEGKQRQKEILLKHVENVENEIHKLEEEAFEGFREGGFSTTEIAEAKDKAFKENSKLQK